MSTSETKPETNPAPDMDRAALASRVIADPGILDELLVALNQQSERAAKAERRVDSLQRQVGQLEHRLAVLLQRMFGRSSEKVDPAQLRLFLEEVAAAEPGSADEVERETVTFTRRKSGHGRGTFPAHLKRDDITLEPEESSRVCTVCQKPCCRIREEVTERGNYIPGYWDVKRYIRGVWACKDGCSVVMAALPPAVVDKSRFEPSVPVHSAVAKFGDHIPLERQAEMHARLGVDVAPTTLGDGVRDLAEVHRPTVTQMETEVLAESHLHSDDTPVVAILETPSASGTTAEAKESGKRPRKERVLARVWVYVAVSGKMFYRFTEDRTRDGAKGPAEVLSSFRGCLIADEYAGYDKICRRLGMKRACCWAHARRKIKDAYETHKKPAGRLLLMIGRLFWLEAAAKKRRRAGTKKFDDDDLLSLRRRRSKKLVDAIMAYAQSVTSSVLPESALGKAIGYVTGNRSHLETFLDDPLVPIDNNAAERALRAIAVGRKNYLHFGSLSGGDAAAVFYSLIGSCKALGINPYAYLLETTKTLLSKPDTPRSELTPWGWAETQARRLTAVPAEAPAASVR